MICSLGTPVLKPQIVTLRKSNKYEYNNLVYHLKIHCGLPINYQWYHYLLVLLWLFVMNNSISFGSFPLC